MPAMKSRPLPVLADLPMADESLVPFARIFERVPDVETLKTPPWRRFLTRWLGAGSDD